jgi:cell division protein FtsX
VPILKLSFRSWRDSPAHQAGAVLLSASLLLSGAVLLHLERSVSHASERVERETRFTVFLASAQSSPAQTDGQKRAPIEDQIRLRLGAYAETEIRTRLVSKAEVLEHLKKNHPDLHAELRDMGDEGEHLLPSALQIVTEVDPAVRAKAVEALDGVQGVESVQTSEGHSRVLRSPVHGLRWLLRALVIGVLAAWVVGWVALARSQASSIARVHHPLKLWGASEFQSRLPGMLAGVWIGLPAALLACGSYIVLARPLLLKLSGESVLFASTGITALSICLCLGFMSLIAGAMVGWVSASSD